MILSSATAAKAQAHRGLKAHLIGIGGSGMQSLARVLLTRGWQLTGSDLAPVRSSWLRAAGVHVARGHAAEQVPDDANLVIYSDAVPADSPERRRAKELGLAQLSYPAMLGQLMAGKRGLAVAGTHGKSTVTSMAASILLAAELDPTVIVGAASKRTDAVARAGDGPTVLVEACEYRANFLHLVPHVAVVLGIEADHFDYYRSLADIEVAFRRFLGQVPSDGLVLAAHDCPATARVIAGLGVSVETFGLTDGATWRAVDVRESRGCHRFRVCYHDQALAEVRLRVAGRHQVVNALASTALAHHCGASPEAVAAGFERFRGLRRRLEVVGSWREVTLVDDYAHHPTEVRAALETMRQLYPGRRLWCVFEPHQASRTSSLLDELAASLQNAEVVAVADIFRAREGPPQPSDVTAADLAARVGRNLGGGGGPRVLDCHLPAEILQRIDNDLQAGDVVLTVGAGSIRKVCDGLASRLRRRCATQ